MDFTLEEIRCILEEMGIKNVPENHLKHFAKDLKHLMKHEKHVQKRKRALGETAVQAPRPTNILPTSKLPERTPPSTSPTISQPMTRPTTSFYPPHQQYSIFTFIIDFFKITELSFVEGGIVIWVLVKHYP